MDRLERAFRDHGRELYAYLVRLCGDRDIAEDLLQEAFLRFADERSIAVVNVRAWLYRVATNRFLDLRRNALRRSELLREAAEAMQEDVATGIDSDLEQREARQRLQKLLGNLDPRDRQLLLLRRAGLKHREIAEVLGTTTASVGTMLVRTLRRARELVKEMDNAEGDV